MSDNSLFRPKAYPARKITDTALQNGACLNPPRMSQIGGLSGLHKTGGVTRNNLTIKKPGGTK